MLRTRAFILLELLIAISLISFCLYLLSNFSKQYNAAFVYANNLQKISKSQIALIKKQDVLELPTQIKTKKITCEALLIKNNPNSGIIFRSYEVQECK